MISATNLARRCQSLARKRPSCNRRQLVALYHVSSSRVVFNAIHKSSIHMTYVIISRFARIVGKLSSTRTAEPRNKATKKTASTKIRKSMNLEGVDRQIESGTPRLR